LLSRGPAAGLVKACQAYPGPLEASTSPASVLGFLNQMAQSPSQFDSASASPHTQVILSVLRVLVQAKGKSHAESKTTLSELIDCILPHEPSATTAAAAAPQAELQRLAAVEKLMLKGQVKEALEAACSAHLWPYALLISSQLGETAFKTTMGRFASEYVPAGSPLKPVFSLMAGQAQELFNQLLPSSASQEQRAMVLDNWRQNVCGILSSRVEGNRRIIGQLGDQLWATRRDNVAAHVCYLLAEHPFQELHAKGARLVLLGGDHKLHRSSFFASPEALYRSEIFEYAKKLANGSFVLPSIQTYRLQYAGLLTDLGFPSRALKYVKAVQTVVDRDRAAFSPILLYHLDLFAARLSSVTTASDDSAESDESASASKLGRVSEFFTSMLSGLVSSQPATAPETAAIESSPFITPPKPQPMVGPPPVSFSNHDSLQASSPGLSPQPSPGLPSEFASSPFMSQPPPPMDQFSSPFVQPNYNQTIQQPHPEHQHQHQHHQQQQQQQQHQHHHQESTHQPISWEPSGLTQPVAGPISWGDPTSNAAPQHRTTATPHLAAEPFSWAPTTSPSPVGAPAAEPISWGTPATQQQHSSASISWASESKVPMPWSSGPVAGPAVPPAHSFAPPPNFQFTPASTTTAPPPPLEDRRPSGAAGFSFKPSGNYEQQAPSIPTSPFAFSPAPSPSAAENELLRSVSMPQIPSKPAAETKATKTPDPSSNPVAAAGGADGGAPGQPGLFGKLFGFLKRPAKEVHLDCNKPVFDEAKGKWVLPGDTDEETAPPPPPPSDNMLGPAIPAHQPPPGSSPSPGMLPPPSISTPSLLSQSGGESSDSDVSRRGPRRRGYVDTLAGGQLRQSFGSMSSLTVDNRPPPPAGFTIFNAAPADPAAEQPPCEST
ncbi:MAG: hypothetical protein Q8P67_02985, partial [archaeon]|nr:hypothetical protein [archaeon]